MQTSVESNAERRAYDALQGMGGPYALLYDVAWLDYGAHRGTQGQCDLLVLNKSRGALAIEPEFGLDLPKGTDELAVAYGVRGALPTAASRNESSSQGG